MESGQASGQLPPKKGEQQAQLNVTRLSLAKGKKRKDPPTGIQGGLYGTSQSHSQEFSVVKTDANIPTNPLTGPCPF
ncbi:hypothetical protein DUI87_10913 [Hirundo rustica rustica]|uniref:Uncharacterized protein n=1 Tax=Hirundo rustica rustica TaxID=333673 RepID=A0A3M0KJE5_HIRRU|nr:hypothetical protein DUI87_10913 [Hirundo rustica rustica]